MARPAVFLDRDGTLIRHVDLLADPSQVELLPSAALALRRLAAARFAVVVVTNQPAVARGVASLAQVDATNARMAELLAAQGVVLDGVYVCPHHPDGVVAAFAFACDCRKPAPGLLVRAALDLDLDLAASFMVGDRATDVEAGRRAGCRAVRVRSDAPPVPLPPGLAREPIPHAVAVDLAEAAEIVLSS